MYGKRDNSMFNPWVIGYEENVKGLVMRLNEGVNGRKECESNVNIKCGMRTR